MRKSVVVVLMFVLIGSLITGCATMQRPAQEKVTSPPSEMLPEKGEGKVPPEEIKSEASQKIDVTLRGDPCPGKLTCYSHDGTWCCPYGYPYLSRCDYRCYDWYTKCNSHIYCR